MVWYSPSSPQASAPAASRRAMTASSSSRPRNSAPSLDESTATMVAREPPARNSSSSRRRGSCHSGRWQPRPATSQTPSTQSRCACRSMSPNTPASTPCARSSWRSETKVASYSSHVVARVTSGTPSAAACSSSSASGRPWPRLTRPSSCSMQTRAAGTPPRSHRALQREVGVLAAAPRAEEAAAGERVRPRAGGAGAGAGDRAGLERRATRRRTGRRRTERWSAARHSPWSPSFVGTTGGTDAVHLEVVAVDGEPGRLGEPRLELGDVAVAVEAHDAAADAADERVAVADGRRDEADLAAPVLHAREQAEVAEELDGAVDRGLADAVAAQGVGRLGDGGGAVGAGEEVPDQPALPRERDALLAKDGLDLVCRLRVGQRACSPGSS